MGPGSFKTWVLHALVTVPPGAYPRITIYGRKELMKRVVRLLVVLLPLALLAGTIPASANDEAGYLAIGDSVAFGFNPLVFQSDPTDTDAYIGYPELLSKHVVNASCSGETSGSLIGGPPDNGCAGFRSVAPLHVRYTGTQLAFAVAYIRAHPQTQLVTIDIGANDLFILLRTCAGSSSCFATGFPAVLSRLASNLVTTYASCRAACFRCRICALPYCATDYGGVVGPELRGGDDQMRRLAQARAGGLTKAAIARDAAAEHDRWRRVGSLGRLEAQQEGIDDRLLVAGGEIGALLLGDRR